MITCLLLELLQLFDIEIQFAFLQLLRCSSPRRLFWRRQFDKILLFTHNLCLLIKFTFLRMRLTHAFSRLANRIQFRQWFPNFSGARTTENILVLREAQNIDLYRDSLTTLANITDH